MANLSGRGNLPSSKELGRRSNSPPDRLDHSLRFGIEYRPLTRGRWRLLGTAGTRDQAEWWLIRFAGGGDFRLRPPVKREGTTHARP
ncbi:hypothetical protein PX52LOC_07499 [Limnoglobus roseus]|uniref:Uncharacterized protein n=1 Tax=Limnoglobus roseus TaxID=2598579 RepID=A0A5C1AP94_9BACT|nr:hypothetical protein PX52LOC_07499 [Limnoglobus roseus]